MHIKENLANVQCHISWGVEQGNLSQLTLSEKDQPSLVDPRLRNATTFGHKIYHVRGSMVNTMHCEIWQCFWEICLCWVWQISLAFPLSTLLHPSTIYNDPSGQSAWKQLGCLKDSTYAPTGGALWFKMLKNYLVTFFSPQIVILRKVTLQENLGSW